jgi:hypothetical protein
MVLAHSAFHESDVTFATDNAQEFINGALASARAHIAGMTVFEAFIL